jgi:hypothetical protein
MLNAFRHIRLVRKSMVIQEKNLSNLDAANILYNDGFMCIFQGVKDG